MYVQQTVKSEERSPTESSLLLRKKTAFSRASLFIFGHSSFIMDLACFCWYPTNHLISHKNSRHFLAPTEIHKMQYRVRGKGLQQVGQSFDLRLVLLSLFGLLQPKQKTTEMWRHGWNSILCCRVVWYFHQICHCHLLMGTFRICSTGLQITNHQSLSLCCNRHRIKQS